MDNNCTRSSNEDSSDTMNQQDLPVSKFPCKKCNRKFTKRGYLTMHMATHTEKGRKHKCVVCGKLFMRGGHLALHMRRHRSRVSDRKNPRPEDDASTDPMKRRKVFIAPTVMHDSSSNCPDDMANTNQEASVNSNTNEYSLDDILDWVVDQQSQQQLTDTVITPSCEYDDAIERILNYLGFQPIIPLQESLQQSQQEWLQQPEQDLLLQQVTDSVITPSCEYNDAIIRIFNDSGFQPIIPLLDSHQQPQQPEQDLLQQQVQESQQQKEVIHSVITPSSESDDEINRIYNDSGFQPIIPLQESLQQPQQPKPDLLQQQEQESPQKQQVIDSVITPSSEYLSDDSILIACDFKQ